MATSYETIYANLLPKFKSYEIPIMTEEEVKGYLGDFFIPAISRFHTCKKDLNDRDDDMEQFNVDLSSIEIEILSNYMLLEYIDSVYIVTPTLLKVNLTSSDFNTYSPANMLDKLMSMRNRYLSENEALLSRYSWLGINKDNALLNSGYKKNKRHF